MFLLTNFIKKLIKPSIFLSIGLVFTIVITYFICTSIGFDPEKLFSDSNVNTLSDKELTSFEHTKGLFMNNIIVPLQILVLAIITVPFLHLIVLLKNGAMIGIIFYIYNAIHLSTGNGDSLFFMIVKGFLPHAVLELFAFVIATALALKINKWIVRKILHLFGKRYEGMYSFKQLLAYSSFVFFVMIVPMILIAAIIEGYITPLLL